MVHHRCADQAVDCSGDTFTTRISNREQVLTPADDHAAPDALNRKVIELELPVSDSQRVSA